MSNCPNHLARNTKWLFTSSACTLQWADLMIETEASPWGIKNSESSILEKDSGEWLPCFRYAMSPKAHALKAWSTVCGATDRWQSETVGQKSLGAPPWRGTWGHLFLSCSQPSWDAQKQRNQVTMAWSSWIVGPKQNPFQMLTACEHHCNGKLTVASTSLQRESEWSGREHAWVLLAEVISGWDVSGAVSLLSLTQPSDSQVPFRSSQVFCERNGQLCTCTHTDSKLTPPQKPDVTKRQDY